MDGEIQYLADTVLLERTFKALAELEDEPLNKVAFDLGSVLSSIGQSISQFVGGQIHGQDSGGVTRTVTNLLAPAIFFRLHPILGLLVTAGQMFGIDIYSIFQSITGAIMPSLSAGQPVSAQELNQAAKAAIPPVTEGEFIGEEVTASDDLLSPLREMEKKGSLTKEGWGKSRGWGSSGTGAWSSQPFVPKDSSPFIRMFSFLSPHKRGNLLVGILVWFIKTVLLSAGLLTVGGVAAHALGVGQTGQSAQGTQGTPGTPGTQGTQSPLTSILPVVSGVPKPTAAGSHVFRPNQNDLWIEELGGQQPHERVLQWVLESYPDLYEYSDIILRTPGFWNTVKDVSKDWRPGQTQLAVPLPYKKRDDVLALFINDIYREVNQERKS